MVHWFVGSFVGSLVRSFVGSLVRWFGGPLVRSIVGSFRWFISLVHFVPPPLLYTLSPSETIEDPHDTAEFARAKIESLLAQHQPAGLQYISLKNKIHFP